MSKAIHFNLLFTEIFSLSFSERIYDFKNLFSTVLLILYNSFISFLYFYFYSFSQRIFLHKFFHNHWFRWLIFFTPLFSWKKLLWTGISLIPKLVIIYLAMYYFNLVLCLRSSRKKREKLCCEFYCKIKMCLKQWTDTLLKAYPMNAQINSFDLWVDVVGKKGKKRTENGMKRSEKNFIFLMWTFQLYIVKLYGSLQPVENFRRNKAIKYLAIACMNNILQRAEKQEIWPSFMGWVFLVFNDR